jgi:hypothetical protein
MATFGVKVGNRRCGTSKGEDDDVGVGAANTGEVGTLVDLCWGLATMANRGDEVGILVDVDASVAASVGAIVADVFALSTAARATCQISITRPANFKTLLGSVVHAMVAVSAMDNDERQVKESTPYPRSVVATRGGAVQFRD